MIFRYCHGFFGLGLSLLLVAPVEGGQVDWSSSAFSTHLTSAGVPLDDSFRFELGAFVDGFTPTAANTADWAAHWRVAQRTAYNSETQLFAASHVVETNASPFGMTEQGYIWGLSINHPAEWVLLTNPEWTWPMAGGANPPESWTVRSSTISVVGTVDRSGEPFFLQTQAVDPANEIPWIRGSAWRSERFTETQLGDGTADWAADPDGDGKSNLTEMALDSDPLVADEPLASLVRVSSRNTLEMTVSKIPRHLLDYFVEVSGDLVTWRRDDAAVEVIVDSAAQLVVRDRTPLTGVQRRFIRLTVVLDE